MARDIQFRIKGRMGNLVFYERWGKIYARSHGGPIRQSEATKKANTKFGQASSIAKWQRQLLLPAIPNARSLPMQRKFTGALSNWLRSYAGEPGPTENMAFVNHFNFNPDAPLETALRVPVGFSQSAKGIFTCSLPAFVPVQAIKAPAGTSNISLLIAVSSCGLYNNHYQDSQFRWLEFPIITSGFQPSGSALPCLLHQGR